MSASLRHSTVYPAIADFSVLKASVAQLPALQDKIKHLEMVHHNLEMKVVQWAKLHVELMDQAVSLQVHTKGLVAENDTFKESVSELEARVKGWGKTMKDMEKGKLVWLCM